MCPDRTGCRGNIAIDVIDIDVIRVVPVRGPRLNETKPIAAVLEARISADQPWAADAEFMPAPKLGAETIIRDATFAPGTESQCRLGSLSPLFIRSSLSVLLPLLTLLLSGLLLLLVLVLLLDALLLLLLVLVLLLGALLLLLFVLVLLLGVLLLLLFVLVLLLNVLLLLSLSLLLFRPCGLVLLLLFRLSLLILFSLVLLLILPCISWSRDCEK